MKIMKKPKTWNFLTSLWWLMASSSKFLMMSSFLQHVTKLFSLVIFIFISLKICRKFIGEHPCRSTISIKLQSNFIVWHRVVVVITTAQFQPSRNSGSAQVRTCSQHVRDSRWWGSLTMVPAGNKTKRLSFVNHTTKTIHQYTSSSSLNHTSAWVFPCKFAATYFQTPFPKNTYGWLLLQRHILDPVKHL